MGVGGWGLGSGVWGQAGGTGAGSSDSLYRELLQRPAGAANRLFPLPSFVPLAAGFRRAPDQTKEHKQGDLIPI